MSFIGREAQLDLLLREVLLAAEAASGRTVFLRGVAGAGKSALALQLLEHAARARPDLQIGRGRCLQSFGTADPYLPFVAALEDLADDTTAGFASRQTLAEVFTELAPYWLSVVPVVGNLLSAGFATAAHLRSGPRPDAAPSRDALFAQFLEVVRRLARQHPLVLLLDDLHWADQASLALLTHLSRGIGALPVLIIGTYRPDDAEVEGTPLAGLIQELEHEELAIRVDLEEMAGAEVEALLRAELGGDVAEPLRRQVIEVAGGNPLFVREFTRLLVQTGRAAEDRGEWQLREAGGALEVPRSAEAVIEKRLGRMNAEDIRILQYASVLGQEFSSTLLASLLDLDELELLDRLEPLERRHQLVVSVGDVTLPNGDVATTLRFAHALVQSVLYLQVVGKRRILLHRRAAATLEELYGGEADRVAGELARHFHQGRVPAAAFRYAAMAADSARAVFAHWEAVELLRMALQHSPGDEETARIEERLGDVYDTVGYQDRGLDAYRQALERTVPGTEASLRLRRKLVMLERKAGLSPAPQLLQRLRALLAEAEQLPVERLHLLLEISILPDTVGARDAAERALELAQTLDDTRLLVTALERLAGVLILVDARTDEGIPHLERAIRLVQDDDDPGRTMMYHSLSGIARAKLGRFADALVEFEAMLQLAERIGDPRPIASACINRGCLMLRLGRWAEAEDQLQRAYVLQRRRRHAGVEQALLNLAERARLAGETELAIERYGRMVEYAREFEYWDAEAVAHAGLGLALLDAGRLPEARAQAERTLAAIADRERWFEDRDLVELFLARIEREAGDATRALERLTRASSAVKQQDVFLWGRLELERVEHLAPHDVAAALFALERVAQAVAEIQAPPLHAQLERVRERLASIGSLASNA